MKPIGLKFILHHGAFLQVVTSQEKAQEIISLFIEGSLPPVVGEPAQNFAGAQAWAVSEADIAAVHTFDVEVPQQQSVPGGSYKTVPYQAPIICGAIRADLNQTPLYQAPICGRMDVSMHPLTISGVDWMGPPDNRFRSS